MLIRSSIAAATLCVALAVPATALAGPGGPAGANVQAHFFDCTGPAGTPTSFDAELQVLGTAWHLLDSHQVFVGMIGFNVTTNTLVIVTPGFERNAVEAVTCLSVRADSGHLFRVIGVLT